MPRLIPSQMRPGINFAQLHLGQKSYRTKFYLSKNRSNFIQKLHIKTKKWTQILALMALKFNWIWCWPNHF
jgi:hypothetical protein